MLKSCNLTKHRRTTVQKGGGTNKMKSLKADLNHRTRKGGKEKDVKKMATQGKS